MIITSENARRLARVLISKRLVLICGMGIDDVPDTSELCDIVDELQGMIESSDKATFKKEVGLFLKENINEDNIEELIL